MRAAGAMPAPMSERVLRTCPPAARTAVAAAAASPATEVTSTVADGRPAAAPAGAGPAATPAVAAASVRASRNELLRGAFDASLRMVPVPSVLVPRLPGIQDIGTFRGRGRHPHG